MRKKLLWAGMILFFGTMLLGTFLHQKIDSLSRIKVEAILPEPYIEEIWEVADVNGVQTDVVRQERFLLIPEEAVKDRMIYTVQTEEVPYGSYEIVRLKPVEIAGAGEGKIKVAGGLSEQEKVVACYDVTLSDGMRVVEEEGKD
mgnify:FL=1